VAWTWVSNVVCVAWAWVTTIVCLVWVAIVFVLDVIGFLIELILSIPIIGAIIRTILNWVLEIFWKAIGIFDFLGSLVGIRPRKKMYFGVVVPSVDGVQIVPDANIQPQVDAAIAFYDSKCNIDLIFSGICKTQVAPPEGGLTVECGAGGFLSDFWTGGSYFEFASATCKFSGSFRRVIGLGAEIIVFVVREITPPSTNGCSFTATHNYVLIEARTTDQELTAAHEMGHACMLTHDDDPLNLMNPTTPAATSSAVLTGTQISVIRWSRHCVYF
jgi:hypothetical protein